MWNNLLKRISHEGGSVLFALFYLNINFVPANLLLKMACLFKDLQYMQSVMSDLHFTNGFLSAVLLCQKLKAKLKLIVMQAISEVSMWLKLFFFVFLFLQVLLLILN